MRYGSYELIHFIDIDQENILVSKRIRALSKYSCDLKLIDYSRSIEKGRIRKAFQPARHGLNIKVVDIVKPGSAAKGSSVSKEENKPLVSPPRTQESFAQVSSVLCEPEPIQTEEATAKQTIKNDSTQADYQFGFSQLNVIHKSLAHEFQKGTMEEFDNLHKQIEEVRARTIKRFQKLYHFMDSSTSSVQNAFRDLK